MSSSVINFPPDRLQKIENRFKNYGFKVGIVPALIDPSKEKKASDEELRTLSKLLEKSDIDSQANSSEVSQLNEFSVYNHRGEVVTHFIEKGKFQNLIA